METFIAAYGPFAFGIATLLILWQVIVKPHLEVQKTQTKALQQTSDTLHQTALTLRETANTNMDVTKELQQIVRDLKGLENVGPVILPLQIRKDDSNAN